MRFYQILTLAGSFAASLSLLGGCNAAVVAIKPASMEPVAAASAVAGVGRAAALRLNAAPLPEPDQYFLTQYQHPRFNPGQATGTNANCGPASLAMALRAFALTEPADEGPAGAQALIRKVRMAMTGAADEQSWTYPIQVQAAARAYGLNAATVRGISAIRTAMATPGRMVAVNLNPTPAYADRLAFPLNAGHFALVTSIDGNRVALSDPLAPGPITISMAELELALTSPLAGGPFGLPVPPYNGGVLLERS